MAPVPVHPGANSRPGSQVKQFAFLILLCISSPGVAREALLPEPDTLKRLRTGEIILNNTQTGEPGVAIQAQVFMKTPVERIWEVIYSCENAFIFLDGLKLCEVLEDNGMVTLTRQVVKRGWLVPEQDYTFRTLREPFKHAEILRTAGKPEVIEASWDFIAMPEGVVVIYKIRIKPDMPAPRFLVRRVMRRGILGMIACIRGLSGGSGSADLESSDLGSCAGDLPGHSGLGDD